MRQVAFRRYGEPTVLEVVQAPDPAPGPGQVRVRVEAAGVNFADLMARMGLYTGTPPLPAVMGWEVAGTVDALGEGVDADWLEAPVIAVPHFGGYATHVVVDLVQVARRPADLPAVEAAAVPVHGLAAWMMLEVMGRVRAGDRVLVHSAGGGVGLICLDLLKWRGAWAAGTASAHKHAFLRERGYDRLVDYRTEDFAEALASEPGFDLILDPIGGASWKRDLALLRGGGRLVCYGYSDAVARKKRSWRALAHTMRTVPWLQFSPFSLMLHNRGVMGIEMEHLWEEKERVRGWLEEVIARWEEGVLRPVIHATVPLEQAAEAHRMLHDHENLGKVVLVTG